MNDWISVKDRLPKINNKYLCVLNNRTISICSFAHNLKKVDKSGWYDYDGEWGYYEVSNVTHWMPLPELPKE